MSDDTRAGLSSKQFAFLLSLSVAILAFISYAKTFSGEFVWDDVSSVLLHEHVKNPRAIGLLFTEDQHAFVGGQGNFYRPLLSVTFMIDYLLSADASMRANPQAIPMKLGTFVFHLSSLLWHIAAALLLALFMTRVGAARAVTAAVVLIYVAHPLHSEAVAYISGRADSMSAVFMFAGLYFATWNESRRGRMIGLGAMVLCFAAGLLSKESTFIFPSDK